MKNWNTILIDFIFPSYPPVNVYNITIDEKKMGRLIPYYANELYFSYPYEGFGKADYLSFLKDIKRIFKIKSLTIDDISKAIENFDPKELKAKDYADLLSYSFYSSAVWKLYLIMFRKEVYSLFFLKIARDLYNSLLNLKDYYKFLAKSFLTILAQLYVDEFVSSLMYLSFDFSDKKKDELTRYFFVSIVSKALRRLCFGESNVYETYEIINPIVKHSHKLFREKSKHEILFYFPVFIFVKKKIKMTNIRKLFGTKFATDVINFEGTIEFQQIYSGRFAHIDYVIPRPTQVYNAFPPHFGLPYSYLYYINLFSRIAEYQINYIWSDIYEVLRR